MGGAAAAARAPRPRVRPPARGRRRGTERLALVGAWPAWGAAPPLRPCRCRCARRLPAGRCWRCWRCRAAAVVQPCPACTPCLSASPLPPSHPPCPRRYIVLNRPYALMQWVQARRCCCCFPCRPLPLCCALAAACCSVGEACPHCCCWCLPRRAAGLSSIGSSASGDGPGAALRPAFAPTEARSRCLSSLQFKRRR